MTEVLYQNRRAFQIENDQLRVSKDDSCANVRQILQLAKSKYRTVLIGPAPVGDAELNTRLMTLTAAYAHEANALGVPFIDVFAHLISDQKYLHESKKNDGYHPRSDGYKAIARIIRTSDNWWFNHL